MKRTLTTKLIALLVLTIQLGFVAEAFCYTKNISTPHRKQQKWYWCGVEVKNFPGTLSKGAKCAFQERVGD